MFYFELAQRCGYPHPDMMLGLLTSKQIAECIAFENVNPQGQAREDLRSAMVSWSIWKTGFRGDPKAKLESFIFKFIKSPPKTIKQMRDAMKGFAARLKRQNV